MFTDPGLAPAAERVVAGSPTVSHVLTAPPPGGDTAAWSWAGAGTEDDTEFQVPLDDDDLADILYTSGTTGSRPRGWPSATATWPSSPAPPPHLLGPQLAALEPPLHLRRHRFHLQPDAAGPVRRLPAPLRRRPLDRDRGANWKPRSLVFLVPSMAQLIVSHESFATADLDSIQICARAGSAPGPLLPSGAPPGADARGLGVSICNGMTEARPGLLLHAPKGEALKRIRARWVKPMAPPRGPDPRRGTTPSCRPGEIGEAVLRMEGRQREYYLQPRGHRLRGPGRTAGSTAATWPGSTRTATSTSSAARRTSSSGAATTSTPSTWRPSCSDHPST